MIIGIGHVSYSGKDTFALYLSTALKHIDRTSNIVSLAWPVKEVSFNLFKDLGLERADFYEKNTFLKDAKLANSKLTPRDIWLAVGQRMRDIDEDVWLRQLASGETDYTIVPDVRNPNEADYIRRNGGIIIKVDRGLEPQNDLDKKLSDFEFDYIIVNDNSLSSLEQQAFELVEELHGPSL